jgi:hypothetical protein
MASPTTKPDAVQPEAEAGVALFDGLCGRPEHDNGFRGGLMRQSA